MKREETIKACMMPGARWGNAVLDFYHVICRSDPAQMFVSGSVV